MSGLTNITSRETRYQSRCSMKKNIQQSKDRIERLHTRNEIRDDISKEVAEELNSIKNTYRRSNRTYNILTR